MRRKITAVFLTFLLIASVTQIFLVGLGNANPYMHYNTVSPPVGSVPLKVLVFSPNNNSIYRTSDVNLTFNITTEGTNIHYLLGAYYKASWLPENVTVYKQNSHSPEFPTLWTYDNKFEHMPDGDYSVNITAWGGGGYPSERLTYNFFHMTTNVIINFTVDTTAPQVSLISIENKTYRQTDLPLDFVIDEKSAQVSYALDGQDNITISGNVTLSSLPVGSHNITLYATDSAGNIDASDTVSFTVSKLESSPTIPNIAIIGITLTVASIGLILFISRHKRKF